MDIERRYKASEKLMAELLVEIKRHGDAVAKKEKPEKIEEIQMKKRELAQQLKDLWKDVNEKKIISSFLIRGSGFLE